MAKQIIMVMGVQRSGTTALFQGLSSDKSLTAYDESIDSVIYDKYRLRPLDHIADVFDAAPGGVLLKPLSETFYRPLENLADEYAAYSLRVVWIYRDPVNVLYSMHRQGWISLSEIGSRIHVDPWVQRNRLALQFQQARPEQIAIVRYEDCVLDPRVFRQLTKWLGLRSRSSFRTDSSSGRKNIPAAAQRLIDAFSVDTVLALDQARRFRPRLLSRIKKAVVQMIAPASSPQSARTADAGWQSSSTTRSGPDDSETELSPASLHGLKFWLDSSANSSRDPDAVPVWTDSGPDRRTAPQVPNGPHLLPCIHGRNALAFQPEMVAERRTGSPGILSFEATFNCAFLFDGQPFSVIAFYKPDVANYPPYNQDRAILMRVRSEDGAAFLLEWDGQLHASKATIVFADEGFGVESSSSAIATTSPGTHRHQEWRVVHVQHDPAEEGMLSISIDGVAGEKSVITRQSGRAAEACELNLGGDADHRDSLFHGAVAEIAIFSRALDVREQRGICRYFARKYDL